MTMFVLCRSTARIIGAAFMKFGRAPTTERILILNATLKVCVDRRGLQVRVGVRRGRVRSNHSYNLIDDTFQSVIVAILRLGKCVPSDDADFRLHVLDAFEEYQTIAVAEILVHCANLAAEGAVD